MKDSLQFSLYFFGLYIDISMPYFTIDVKMIEEIPKGIPLPLLFTPAYVALCTDWVILVNLLAYFSGLSADEFSDWFAALVQI